MMEADAEDGATNYGIWGTPKGGRSKGTDSPLVSPRNTLILAMTHFGLLASRMVREYMSRF